MSDQNVAFTNEDVAAFSSKLDQWGATLAPRERALLDVLVKLAGEGLPAGSELSETQLEAVAGGTGPLGLGQQTSFLFGRLMSGPFMSQASCQGVIVRPR